LKLALDSLLVVPMDAKNMRSKSARFLWIMGMTRLLAPHILELRISPYGYIPGVTADLCFVLQRYLCGHDEHRGAR
jgi:hypothetical protein